MSETTAWRTTSCFAAYDADWQTPARTEQYAYQQLVRSGVHGVSWLYVAFPWASFIDGHIRGTELGARLKRALSGFPKPAGKKRVVTVCQHIKFRDYMYVFESVGITDVFASHAEIGEKCLGKINIHPFPLYPVQAENANGAEELGIAAFLERSHLYSFVGSYNPKHYLTPVRGWIAEIGDAPGAFVSYTDQWHFEKRVYDNQVYGRLLTDTEMESERTAAENFVDLLKNTQFSLCPSGTGPNSIRLWESLEYGSIPVILSDRLALPGQIELWQRACVFAEESFECVKALPQRLLELARDELLIADKLAACATLRDLYGLKGFTTGLEAFLGRMDRLPDQVGDEIDFSVDAGALAEADMSRWRDFLKSAAASVGRCCRVTFEQAGGMAGHGDIGSHLDTHDWGNEDLVIVSDSRALSARLLRQFDHFFIAPKGAPRRVNIDLAVVQMSGDFTEAEVTAPDDCWAPICSVITSVFDGEKYIADFLANAAMFENYAEIEHFIALPNSPGREFEHLRRHALAYPGVVFVWLARDPGLYGIWNYFSRLASSRHISNANIDDKRAPSHIRRLVEILDRDRDCEVASAGVRITKDIHTTWATSEGLPEWYVGGDLSRKGFADLYKSVDGIVCSHNFPHCMPVWRASLAAANGEFEEHRFGPSSDWEYWLRAGRRGSAFAHLGEALGVYYIAPASYWRRNPKAQQFEDNIHREHFGMARGAGVAELGPTSRRVLGIVSDRKTGRHLEALVSLLRLIADLQAGRLEGERTRALVAFVAGWYGIDAPLDLCLGHDWQDLSPGAELEAAMSLVIDRTHAAGKIAPIVADSFRDIARDYFVRTADVKGILILALIARQAGNGEVEARLLAWGYAFDRALFFKRLNDVYRFAAPLAKVLSAIPVLPPFQDGPLFVGAQRIFFFPDYLAGNPYQGLLYAAAKARNVEVVGVGEGDYETFFGPDGAAGAGDVVHIHWLNSIFKNSTPSEHAEIADGFLAAVRRLQRRGVAVYWTVHNLYNHDNQDRTLERRFRRDLSHQVDRVYVHHPALLAELGEWLDSTDKVCFIEHGSHVGTYRNAMSRESARARLGIDEGDFVLAVVGQIREYKDLARYVPRIVEAMRRDGRIRLLVAGKVRCEETRAALAEVPAERLKLVDRFIPDDEFDVYLNAASVVLLTYRHILTSGSLFQALSFGRPVLAPDIGSIPCYVSDYHNGFVYTEPTFADRLRLFLGASAEKMKQMSDNARAAAESLSWPG